MSFPDKIHMLRLEIVKEFESHWQLNDEAHRTQHFEDVFICGMDINNKMSLGFSHKVIMFAAYFHDLFSWTRINHHVLSSTYVATSDHPLFEKHLTPQERSMVSWACLQHRASFKEDFHDKFCELINSADRGFPDDVEAKVERARQCRRKWHPEMSEDEVNAGAIAHIKEKYGHGGYARYSDMYLHVYGDLLQQQRDTIMSL